jgi:hypothetical protein
MTSRIEYGGDYSTEGDGPRQALGAPPEMA